MMNLGIRTLKTQLRHWESASIFLHLKSLSLIALCALLSGCGKGAPETERELATRVLAEHVTKVAQPKSVLVFSNPFSEQGGRPAQVYAFEKAGLAGLREGFGSETPLTVVFPKLKPEVARNPGSVQVDPQSATPLSFLVAEQSFSELIQQHSQSDLVVSLIGLPVNLAEFKAWSEPGTPRFALLLPDWRMIGGRDAILRVFQEKKLIAAVVNKPNAPEAGSSLSSDYRAEFERRFLLVTPENAESHLQQFPFLFGLQ